MKIFRNILIWLNALLAFLGGGVLLWLPQGIDKWFQEHGNRLVARASEPGTFALLLENIGDVSRYSAASGILGASMIACSILLVWAALRGSGRGGYADHLEFSDSEGRFHVSVKALEQALARSLMRLEEVHDMRVLIQACKGPEHTPMIIIAHGGVYENHDLMQVRERLRTTLRQNLLGMIQLGEDVKYDVHLHRIIPVRKSGKGEAKAADFPEGSPRNLDVSFGPKYPIEAENEGTA